MPRLLAIHIRFGDTQLHRADLVQARFQRAVQQLVQLVQLTQGHLHLAHRPVALQHRLAGFQVVIFRLGAQVGGADVFLLDVVFLQEIKVLRHALVHLLLRLGGVFGETLTSIARVAISGVASTLAVPEVTTCGPSGTSAACSAIGNVPNPTIAAIANAFSFTVSP